MSSSSFTGFRPLLRLALRRDRVKLPVWLLGIAGMSAYFANALEIAYPAQDDLEAIMGFMSGPAGTVMTGPGYGFDDPTHAIVFAGGYGLYLLVAAAFLSVLLVARHSRAEEESGRLELVRAAAVGRHAPLAVATVLLLAANAMLFLLTWALVAGPYGSGGAALFAAGLATVGLVFGSLTLVAVQLTEHTRSAVGLASAAVGAAVVIRGVGDILEQHGSWLSWFSPIAWAQQTRVFYDDRWWPLLLGAAAALLQLMLGYRLQGRRDLGAGILPARLGSSRAAGWLGSPLGLAFRLERGAMAAWATALLVMGLGYGGLTDSVESSLGQMDNELLVEALGGDPTQLVDGYLATSAMFTAFLAAAYAITAAHRLPKEERETRTEVVLSTAVSRPRLLLAGLAIALLGSVAALLAGGLGMGLGAALVTRDGSFVATGLESHLVYVPAVAVVLGLAALGYAVRPGWLNVAWLVAVWSMLVGYLGGILDLPQWLIDLSPFGHIALVPLEEQPVGPLVVLSVIAVLLAALSVLRFRSRDLTTA